MRIVVVAVLLSLSLMRPAAPPIIAVLEHPQCQHSLARAVRVLFSKADSGWQRVSEETWGSLNPATKSWTVAFDGRSIGTVGTIDPGVNKYGAWFSRDRLLDIRNAKDAPRVANPSHLFGGWCEPPQDRPLVLVADGSAEDPDSWKPAATAPSLRDSLLAHFKAAVGKVSVCRNDKLVAFEIRATDLQFGRSYRSGKDERLVSVHLNKNRYGCDGVRDDEWSSHLFLLSSNAVRHIGHSLDLVDAGDYDGDGRSELLFWFSSYNADGYTLLFDHFARRADYHWSYH